VTWEWELLPGNAAGAANTLGYTWDTAEMQQPEVVYTPTSYNAAHPAMASSGPARFWS
jgi:hypothetical protein